MIIWEFISDIRKNSHSPSLATSVEPKRPAASQPILVQGTGNTKPHLKTISGEIRGQRAEYVADILPSYTRDRKQLLEADRD